MQDLAAPGLDGQVLSTVPAVVSAGNIALDVRLSTDVAELSSPSISLYPNPATDEVRMRFTGKAPRTIEVMDATGRRVSTERYRADGAISVSGLSEGLYVVRALDTDGRALAQQRLIVQR